MAKSPTDPYKLCNFAIGSGEDFICFDFSPSGRKVWLHSVVNSETGHFIEDFRSPVLVPRDAAVAYALEMVEDAIEWCALNDVKHDAKGWDQDEQYFARAVAYALMDRFSQGLYPLVRRIKKGRRNG